MTRKHDKMPPILFGQASRRQFLKGMVSSTAALATAGAGALSARSVAAAAALEREPSGITRLSDHVLVYHGPTNVGIVRNGAEALLIDCGDGSVGDVLSRIGVRKVTQLVFTHHHRDQACGANRFVESGARTAVPATEKDLFADPATYWNNDGHIFRVYRTFRPDHLTLIEPIRVDRELNDGDELRFGPARLRILATPGHTEGSVSILVDVDGQKVVFSGDCISDAGQVWDIYSLQKGFSKGGRTIGG
ncbi:MAG TPA: MBL fold metallo-hydrolase, partial [Planctomycetaceae bacterium]|nr:MBL fold metallo-hydrolase [Planctomycetaceae bacterium]